MSKYELSDTAKALKIEFKKILNKRPRDWNCGKESMIDYENYLKKEMFRKEIDDIIEWADRTEWELVKNSPIKGLDVNRSECKKIHVEMMKKIENVKAKYDLPDYRITI